METASGDYSYVLLDDGTAEITEYHGEAETLEIPGALDSHSVISIGDNVFYACDSLTSIRVGRDSCTKQYCVDNSLPFACADAND